MNRKDIASNRLLLLILDISGGQGNDRSICSGGFLEQRGEGMKESEGEGKAKLEEETTCGNPSLNRFSFFSSNLKTFVPPKL